MNQADLGHFSFYRSRQKNVGKPAKLKSHSGLSTWGQCVDNLLVPIVALDGQSLNQICEEIQEFSEVLNGTWEPKRPSKKWIQRRSKRWPSVEKLEPSVTPIREGLIGDASQAGGASYTDISNQHPL